MCSARTWIFLALSSRSNTDAASFHPSLNARAMNATISSAAVILGRSSSEALLIKGVMPFRALALAVASSLAPLQRSKVTTCGTGGPARNQ